MARRLEIEIVGDASRLQREFRKAAQSAKVFNTQITGTFKGLSRGAGFGLAAGGIASVGLAVRSTINATIDFESAFAGVRKTVDATEPQLRALAVGFRELSKEIPVTVNELSAIGEAAGQLGIRRNAILQFTETVAALGVTTNLASEEAANALARMANITQLPQDEFDRLGSTVVELGNKLAATESEIVDFGLRIAAAGKIVGLTVDQTLAVAGAFTSVGVEAEAGGTAVSKVFIALANSVKSGGKQLDLFAQTAGVSAAEFRKQFTQNAAGAFVSFVEGLRRVDKEGGNVFKTLTDLGLTDQRLTRAFLSISQSGDLLRRSLQVGSKAWRENSALTKEAEKRYATAASRLKVFQNRVNDLQITLGAALVPALEDIIVPLSAWIEKTENQKRAQKALADVVSDAREVFTGIKNVVVPLAEIAGTLSDKLGGLRRSVELLLVVMVASKVVAFAQSITGLGTASAASAGKVNILRTALLRLGAIGVIAIGVELILHKDQIDDFVRGKLPTFLGGKGSVDIPVNPVLKVERLRQIRDNLADVFGEGAEKVKEIDALINRILRKINKGATFKITTQMASATRPQGPDIPNFGAGPGAVSDRSAAAARAAAAKAATEAKALSDEQRDAAAAIAKARRAAATAAEKAAEAARNAAEKIRTAFDVLMDSLDLRLEKATITARFTDDLAALKAMEKAIQAQIEEEGKTIELQRRLFEIRQERADLVRQQRNTKQFEALNLTAEGEVKTPSVSALTKRLGNLRERIKGTLLDTSKTRSQLKRISQVLAGNFGAVGKDVRAAILQMFNDIASGFDQGEKTTGKLTKRRITAASGAGSVSAFGVNFSQSNAAAARASTTPIHVHLMLDGKEVSNVVLSEAQLRNRRHVGTRGGRQGGTKLF